MEYLTPKMLCQKLSISRTTLFRHVKKGMPFVFVGAKKRFVLEQVISWYNDGNNATVPVDDDNSMERLQKVFKQIDDEITNG